jgi:hypothetical protein
MAMKEYTTEELVAQPIGYWSGEGHRIVVGRIRDDLAVEQLTQPHWWILNHVAGTPGSWTRGTLTERLTSFDDLGIDFGEVFSDLVGRGWLEEDGGTLTLTVDGEAGRLRAKARSAQALDQLHEGIRPDEYVACLNVLRRMIFNLGGNSDLP